MRYTFRMKKGKKSRYKPQAGDLFCYEILPDRVHFGRVIKVGFGPIPDSGLVLLYFYAETSTSAECIPELNPSDLLIPPLITHEESLLQGYLQHIASKPLLDGDVLASHCFHCSFTNRYFDEESRDLKHRTEPCGTKGWATLVGIDRQLSEALGLPEDEDTDDDDDSYNNDDGYHIWPSDRINDKVVTLQIRIPEMADPGAESVDRGAIEEHIESQLKDGKLAEWYASGSFSKYSHIDYDIHPGQFPAVHAIVERVMKDFGVTQYRILVQE